MIKRNEFSPDKQGITRGSRENHLLARSDEKFRLATIRVVVARIVPIKESPARRIAIFSLNPVPASEIHQALHLEKPVLSLPFKISTACRSSLRRAAISFL